MARQSIPGLVLTFTAAGTVTEGRAIGFNDAQASTAGQKIKGIAQTAAAPGTTGAVVVSGTAIVEAGGAFAIGDSLTVDVQGRAVVSANAADFVFADALAQASGAGKFVEVLLRR